MCCNRCNCCNGCNRCNCCNGCNNSGNANGCGCSGSNTNTSCGCAGTRPGGCGAEVGENCNFRRGYTAGYSAGYEVGFRDGFCARGNNGIMPLEVPRPIADSGCGCAGGCR